MNTWRSRLAFALLLWCAMQIHTMATVSLPNNPAGMTVFHGSAALLDLLLLYCAPAMMRGRVCDDIQTLCLLSIAGNALGWLAYLAYAPPEIYDIAMWCLSIVQWGRLLFAETGDADHMGLDLVRGADYGRA